MDNLKELLKFNMNKNMLKDIVCEFLENGHIQISVDENSYIGYTNIINVSGESYDLLKYDFEVLIDFFRENEFSFSDIESTDCSDVFRYYIYN